MISSPQNDKVKLAYALQTQAKVRRRERKIALEGVRLVGDAIARGRKPEFILYDAQAVDYGLIADWQNRIGAGNLYAAAPDIIQRLSTTEHSQGIIAVLPIPMPDLPRQPRRILILDGVRDPGNMGTILRTAAAAGVQIVVLSPDCVDPYNPKALRGGMGAHFRVPVVEASWQEIAQYCEGLPVYLAAGDGDTAYDSVDWSVWVLIIGSEAHGASEPARALATRIIRIPMAAETESINAAAAAAVILFEAARQRRHAREK
ncbi:MAG: RNA methyltransferase [Anaerolineae bacterium]|nr:RNA methyltransferase [Anaerolineae bacterium]